MARSSVGKKLSLAFYKATKCYSTDCVFTQAFVWNRSFTSCSEPCFRIHAKHINRGFSMSWENDQFSSGTHVTNCKAASHITGKQSSSSFFRFQLYTRRIVLKAHNLIESRQHCFLRVHGANGTVVLYLPHRMVKNWPTMLSHTLGKKGESTHYDGTI